MTWPAEFLDVINDERGFKPIFKVVRHTWPEWGQPGDGFIASTHPNFIDSHRTILDGSVVLQGEKLNTATAIASGGGFSFMVSENPCVYLTRGHVLRLYMGFDVIDENDMALLTWGVVRTISSHGGVKLTTSATKQG